MLRQQQQQEEEQEQEQQPALAPRPQPAAAAAAMLPRQPHPRGQAAVYELQEEAAADRVPRRRAIDDAGPQDAVLRPARGHQLLTLHLLPALGGGRRAGLEGAMHAGLLRSEPLASW